MARTLNVGLESANQRWIANTWYLVWHNYAS